VINATRETVTTKQQCTLTLLCKTYVKHECACAGRNGHQKNQQKPICHYNGSLNHIFHLSSPFPQPTTTTTKPYAFFSACHFFGPFGRHFERTTRRAVPCLLYVHDNYQLP